VHPHLRSARSALLKRTSSTHSELAEEDRRRVSQTIWRNAEGSAGQSEIAGRQEPMGSAKQPQPPMDARQDASMGGSPSAPPPSQSPTFPTHQAENIALARSWQAGQLLLSHALRAPQLHLEGWRDANHLPTVTGDRSGSSYGHYEGGSD